MKKNFGSSCRAPTSQWTAVLCQLYLSVISPTVCRWRLSAKSLLPTLSLSFPPSFSSATTTIQRHQRKAPTTHLHLFQHSPTALRALLPIYHKVLVTLIRPYERAPVGLHFPGTYTCCSRQFAASEPGAPRHHHHLVPPLPPTVTGRELQPSGIVVTAAWLSGFHNHCFN